MGYLLGSTVHPYPHHAWLVKSEGLRLGAPNLKMFRMPTPGGVQGGEPKGYFDQRTYTCTSSSTPPKTNGWRAPK